MPLLPGCTSEQPDTDNASRPLDLKDIFCLVTPNECNREAYEKLFPGLRGGRPTAPTVD